MTKPSAVVFDLDGTLVDSAPDYVAALNELLDADGQPAVDFTIARNRVSRGAYALLDLGFGPSQKTPERMRLRERLLEIYGGRLTRSSTLFDGVENLLDTIEQRGITWAIATNKPTFLTLPVLKHFGLERRSAGLVCGDTLQRPKPAPDPILHVCQMANIDPATAVMVGDASCDIEAGHAAGLTTVVATYGYIAAEIDVSDWAADYLIQQPGQLLELL